MKQGSFRAVRLAVFLLAILCFTSFAAWGDEWTVDYESIVLETFNGDAEHEWTFLGKTYKNDFEWKVDASKFASRIGEESFPKMAYIQSYPMALYGNDWQREGEEKREHNTLGIWGKFDRRGYNWIDVYPVKPGQEDSDDEDAEDPETFEIPIPGRISYLDMWVWGSNLNYYLEAYFRDHQGVVHSLYMGSLGYQGWRNLRVRIPTSISQSRRILPRFAGLTFVKFRIWTTPVERVDNFFIYFSQMKVLTDTFESRFDGNELADPDRVQELWNQQARAQE